MHYSNLMFLLLWATACGDGNPDGDTSTGVTDVGPAEGHWSFSTTLISSTCDPTTTDNGTIDEAGLTLERTEEGFRALLDMPDEQDETTLHCTVIDDSFVCDQRSTDFPTEGMDAVLTVAEDISGDFPTWTEMNAVVEIALECTGADCDTFKSATGMTLPCGVELDLLGEMDEE